MDDIENDTGEVEDAKLEALIETAGMADIDEDTSGIEDTDGLLVDPADETSGIDDDDDTGAPLRRALKIATQVNPKKLSVKGLAKGLAKMRQIGKKQAKKKRPIRGTPAPSPTIQARREVARTWREANPGQKLRVRKAFYYQNVFVEFDVSGTAAAAVATLASGKSISGFHKYVGDTVTLTANGGTNVVLTESDTNLAKNGSTNYPKQEFLIERTSFADGGILMFYDATTVDATSLAADIKTALKGGMPLHDEDGLFVPKGIYHDQTGRNELFRALAIGSVLRFAATKINVGSNRDARDQLVDSMDNIPSVGRGSPIGMTMTSGGGEWPYLEKAWRWKLDLNDPEAEEFTTTIETRRKVALGFTPVKATGGSTADVPTKIVLIVRIRHEGTSFHKVSTSRSARV